MPDTSIQSLLAEALPRLRGTAGAAQARLETELLLAAAAGRRRSWLRAFPETLLDAAAVTRFRELVARRAAGEPVAQLLGRREFWSLELTVSPATLIPRPETEELVARALELLPEHEAAEVLDLGTGSGAIALALAHERPRLRVLAVDRSPAALAVARGNARRLGLTGLRFLAGDWYAALRGGPRFALIVSNPPYVAENDPHLGRGDLRFEPREALAAGRDGLDALRRVIGGAPQYLRPGGRLLVEHGRDQGAAVRALFAGAGFTAVATRRDLAGHERLTEGQCDTR